MERFARAMESAKELERGKVMVLVSVILAFPEKFATNALILTTCHTKMNIKLCAHLAIILVWVNALVQVLRNVWLVNPDSSCMLKKDARYVPSKLS